MRLLAICPPPLPPAVAALGWPVFGGRRVRVGLLPVIALTHLFLVATLWAVPEPAALGGWIAADPLGLTVLTLTSVLFLVTVTYTVGYLRREKPRSGRVFAGGLLAFLSAASVVSLAQHLAMLWVGMEATTLAVAPLVFLRRDRRSLEATWKDLVISSVGTAPPLLGTLFLATAQADVPGRPLVRPARSHRAR